MILYPEYNPSRSDLAAFIASQGAARLVTLDGRGAPRVGIYPFLAWLDDDPFRAEVHVVSGDPQAQDLARDPRCTLVFDEVLTYVPSHWQGDDSALHADLYYRFASVAGVAEVVPDRELLAEHLRGLLSRYQPEGGHRQVTAEDPGYAPHLARLALVRFRATAPPVAKFKLGQKASAEERARIRERLAATGEAGRCAVEVLDGIAVGPGEQHETS